MSLTTPEPQRVTGVIRITGLPSPSRGLMGLSSCRTPGKPQTSHPGGGDLDCRYGTGTLHHCGAAAWGLWALGLWWICGEFGAGGLGRAGVGSSVRSRLPPVCVWGPIGR